MSEDIKKARELLDAVTEKAKELLLYAGYAVIKITDEMESQMNKCAEGECDAEDCLGCCCSICILHN